MRIAGVDEAGRGPLAGPVVAAAVIFPDGYSNDQIKDSKKLSARMREKLREIVIKDAAQWSIVAVGHRRIENLNIREASKLAMSLALRRVNADLALIDGNMAITTTINQETIVGGDATVLQISAASILAKVWRDHLMTLIDKKYPGYEFSRHAGYPTALHRALIKQYGPSKIHRRTFAGVKEHLTSKVAERSSHYSASVL